MNKIAIYPGTFDPITNGHIDVIERATKIFDKVIVVIAVNSKKVNLFSEKERLEMVKSSLSNYSNVSVDLITGLLVEYAALNNASAIIRGVRSVTDFEYEMQIALMNRKMQPEIQTVFMMPNEKYTYLNSSIIREISRYGQDTSEFVPDVVSIKLKEKFNDLNKS
ncbi:MAG: pantetheine-phosphate adenylyltransferase [Candidatus Kapabacteria bacterium]|nr:pantetheine-phosphate adenylyltransferase [Candidatus Kapabacteria bacterium]